MSDVQKTAVREKSLSMVAAMVVALETHDREVREELAHHRSVLRNALAGKTWTDGTYVVEFRPGYMKAVPSKRIGNALAFRRYRMDPYMSVRRKAAKK